MTPPNSTVEQRRPARIPRRRRTTSATCSRTCSRTAQRRGSWHQVLVFTRTKHGANRLAEQLSRAGIRSAAIHGNKSQARAPARWPTSRPSTSSGARRDRSRIARPRHPANCRTSSTSTCRTCPRTTCTASAAPRAPATTAMPCRSCLRTRLHCCATLKGRCASPVPFSPTPDFRTRGTLPRRPRSARRRPRPRGASTAARGDSSGRRFG